MSELLEVRLVDLPDCWDSCGNCRADEFEVVGLHVAVGDRVHRYQPLLSWEADKAAFELPAPQAGVIAAVLVEEGDCFGVDEVVVLMEV
ncbi:MAG: biotin/lipoyl-containing protein [Halopseudomonas sp.]